MPKLNWKLLTKKRAGVTQGLPKGKEDLAWVTNTVTPIYGERNAVLVDTFLSVQHSKELVDWLGESGRISQLFTSPMPTATCLIRLRASPPRKPGFVP